MNIAVLAWVLVAGGVAFLLGPWLLRDRRDTTGLLLTSLFGATMLLRGILFLVYGNRPEDHSKLQAKSLGMVTGIVIGVGIALIVHVFVRTAKASNGPGGPEPER